MTNNTMATNRQGQTIQTIQWLKIDKDKQYNG